MTRRILIVGAAIVGAASLAEVDDVTVTVLGAGSGERPLESTGHAPGFVGLLNEVRGATEVALVSAGICEQCSGRDVAGLDRVGGVEVALTEAALDELGQRAERIAPGGCVRRRALPRGRNRPRRRGHRGVQGPRTPGQARFAYEDAVTGMDASGARSAGPAPDLPLLGPIEHVAGLWVAQALWVTHAGGAAALAAIVTGREPDIPGLPVLRPQRGDGQTRDELRARAWRLYRDIYAAA